MENETENSGVRFFKVKNQDNFVQTVVNSFGFRIIMDRRRAKATGIKAMFRSAFIRISQL